jgi:hypothetical protein
MARKGQRGGERGAVLVETAILIPIIILITFGLIEFSSVYQSSASGAGAVRSAARTASALPGVTNFATSAASAASTTLRVIGADEPVELWVYKANNLGFPGGTGATGFATCATSCIKFTWNQANRDFTTNGMSGGGWPYSSQNACTQPYDEIGVYVKLQHAYITKLFGANITLTDHAVFRLEPAPSGTCP